MADKTTVERMKTNATAKDKKRCRECGDVAKIKYIHTTKMDMIEAYYCDDCAGGLGLLEK